MAIRGINLSEKESFIHPDDPGHPDNVEIELETRVQRKAKIEDVDVSAISKAERDAILQSIKNDIEFKPTQYFVGVLTATDRTELGDMVAAPTMRDNGITLTPRNNERISEIVRRGLKGWVNQQDHAGTQVEFETATAQNIKGRPIVVASDKSIACLPTFVINWLADTISQKNGMTVDLVKKSSGVSQPSLDQILGTGDAPNAQNLNASKEAAPSLQKGE